MFCVYLLQNAEDTSWYIGYSANLRQRVERHQKEDGARTTKLKKNWRLIYYEDGQWVQLDIEWRASDTSARYRINQGSWTGWHPFQNPSSFAGFDHIGFDVVAVGGGGVYFDSLK